MTTRQETHIKTPSRSTSSSSSSSSSFSVPSLQLPHDHHHLQQEQRVGVDFTLESSARPLSAVRLSSPPGPKPKHRHGKQVQIVAPAAAAPTAAAAEEEKAEENFEMSTTTQLTPPRPSARVPYALSEPRAPRASSYLAVPSSLALGTPSRPSPFDAHARSAGQLQAQSDEQEREMLSILPSPAATTYHPLPSPSPAGFPSSPTPSTARSPLRNIFRTRARTLSSPLSPGFGFGLGLGPPSPSISKSKAQLAGVSFEVHLFDFGTHSELAFEPLAQDRGGADGGGSGLAGGIPLTPRSSPAQGAGAGARGQPFSPLAFDGQPNTTTNPTIPMTGYRVACETMNHREVVLVCRTEGGQRVAKLRTSNRGTEIEVVNVDSERGGITMVEKGQGGQRVYLDDETYDWAESTGLALLVSLTTRRSLAKMHYRVFGRDKLAIVVEGLEQIPLIVITAAKLWFEHHSERDFRLE